MSTEDFLGACQRFTSRRGNPQIIYTDNGGNFEGANLKLRRAVDLFNSKELKYFASENHTIWKYITPSAPHEGGIWEASVKSMKFHLKRVMGQQKYSIQAATFLLANIEGCLKSGPLCAMLDDANDFETLTPAYFLIGRPIKLPMHEEMDSPPPTTKRLYKAIQFQVQSIWKQWTKDYSHTLTQKPKWKDKQENVKLGDLVLIKANNTPPTFWSMGRVIELNKGEDGKVRSVKL